MDLIFFMQVQNNKNASLPECRLKIGKLNISHGVSSKNALDRVPLTYISFHPKKNNRFLLSGGSILSVWEIQETSENQTIPLNNSENNYIQKKDQGSRWLHAEACNCPFTSTAIDLYNYHTPNIVNRALYSKDGDFILSSDSNNVILWNVLENKPFRTYKSSDIFDVVFLDSDHIIVGSIDVINIISLHNLKVVKSINSNKNVFFKSLTCEFYQKINGFAEYKLAVTTNTIYTAIYIIKMLKSDENVNITESVEYVVPAKFFDKNTMDIPFHRLPSFSFDARYVCFPFGTRKGQFFGLLCDLNSTQEPYRVRGHQSRINCVAFSRVEHNLFLNPLKFLSAEHSNDKIKFNFISKIFNESFNCNLKNDLFPTFFLLAMGSVDGCLSIWCIWNSNNESEISGLCLFVTSNSIVDQAAIITSLVWSNDTNNLLVTSDDGKITVVKIEWDFEDDFGLKVEPQCGSNKALFYIKKKPKHLEPLSGENNSEK